MNLPEMLQSLLAQPALQQGLALQIETQKAFYQRAKVIAGAECPVSLPAEDMFSVERNFFSTFFLAVTACITKDPSRLPLYAMVNQGMRAWVTACDNILDDEYKEIFCFTFPGEGMRVRSVLTLLLADRVVTEFIAETYGDLAMITEVGKSSLQSLIPCALQECEEEIRPVSVLPPEEILRDIHKRKTADLFVAPLALPLAMETVDPAIADAAVAAVRRFGQACQIIDDLKDMPGDVCEGRHNLLVSIVAQENDDEYWLDHLRAIDEWDWASWERYPAAARSAAQMAMGEFQGSFEALATIGISLSSSQRDAVISCIFTLLKVPMTLIQRPDEGH